MQANDPRQEGFGIPDARVLWVIAIPCGKIVITAGVYPLTSRISLGTRPRAARKPTRENEKTKPATNTLTSTLTPVPLKSQLVSDVLFPPPYFATAVGRSSLRIEAGMGNYELYVKLRSPLSIRDPIRLEVDP